MNNPTFHSLRPVWRGLAILIAAAIVLLVVSCARMGQPDGGWYDEQAPRIVGATPEDKATGVKSQRMAIYFDEYIKVDNPTENVVVSPPQLEMPEIKGAGKRILIHLLDTLKENTTYTIDFSDAITDNNEDNPLGNYTYSFSTGDHIDTMEVSGYVLDAESLEPVKGIQVGLYANLEDSAFTTEPMLRNGRTDDSGHFVIKGIAPGSYRIYGLHDMDGNYHLSQRGEQQAFNHDIIVPSSKPDVRHDTIWRDSLRIDSLIRIPYTHYLPDDIVLRAFTPIQNERVFLKAERKEANRFSLFFTYGDSILPTVRLLSPAAPLIFPQGDDGNTASTGDEFPSLGGVGKENPFIVEPTERGDTLTYWLADTTLVNTDTLTIAVTYNTYTYPEAENDSVAVPYAAARLQPNTITDTLTILSKEPYAKRLKQQEKEFNDWKKKQDKLKKKGEPYDSIMPVKPLDVQFKAGSPFAPDQSILVTMPTPIVDPDTSMIHLYVKRDTLWFEAPFLFRPYRPVRSGSAIETDYVVPRTYELVGEWRPETEYSLEIDSAAFHDIYGLVSAPIKQGFKVAADDEFASLFMTIEEMSGKPLVVQLLNSSDKVVREVATDNGTAEFFYVKPGTYYMRLFTDLNRNGRWDTGDYLLDLQPETVYYYPESIECKAKWDLTLTWNPTLRPVYRQKPGAITQQKGEKKKALNSRNYERAKKLGIEYIRDKVGQ